MPRVILSGMVAIGGAILGIIFYQEDPLSGIGIAAAAAAIGLGILLPSKNR